jgi:hypothetical protein
MATVKRLGRPSGLIAAIVAGPLLATAVAPAASASGDCLAWFGSRGDGICMGYSNGSPTYVGTPNVGVYGPGGVSSGVGLVTGPLLPGQTINIPVAP